MIERLQDLRAVAMDGGETPVVVRDVANIYEQACAELMPVNVYMANDDGSQLIGRTCLTETHRRQ